MSLNIKNPRVHELAREAARRSGMTQTAAIEKALELMLAEMDEEDTAIDALLEGLQKDIEVRGPLQDADLYDESGLPA
jgi:antitoxin VapB